MTAKIEKSRKERRVWVTDSPCSIQIPPSTCSKKAWQDEKIQVDYFCQITPHRNHQVEFCCISMTHQLNLFTKALNLLKPIRNDYSNYRKHYQVMMVIVMVAPHYKLPRG